MHICEYGGGADRELPGKGMRQLPSAPLYGCFSYPHSFYNVTIQRAVPADAHMFLIPGAVTSDSVV